MSRTGPSLERLDAELLEAVAASPDDDAPRQVFADRLLERDDPRGTFIRNGCALQTLALQASPTPPPGASSAQATTRDSRPNPSRSSRRSSTSPR
jgi:uncharacterized protein (TIGR02996 family)